MVRWIQGGGSLCRTACLSRWRWARPVADGSAVVEQRYSVMHRARILARDGHILTVDGLVEDFGISPAYARNVLCNLRREGMIELAGMVKNSRRGGAPPIRLWRKQRRASA